MFSKFMGLEPIYRRVILAVVLLAICCIDTEFPKNRVSDTIFVVCLSAWYYTVGLVRPTILFFAFLLKVVFRYRAYND